MRSPEKILVGHDVYDVEPFRPDLIFASWFYSCGRLAHRAAYSSGIKQRRRLPKPVICVGNLTVGGTGKTPFLIYLANELRRRGLMSAILSRGYRANPEANPPRIVSDGKEVFGSAASCGDEPLLLARRCPGVPVVIGTSRYDAGLLAMEKVQCDLFLLDDGFQHEALTRDADIVLWDVQDRPSRMRQLPAGRLREGLGGLERASAILLTHAEYLPKHMRAIRIEEALKGIKSRAPRAPVFTAQTRLTSVRPIGKQEDPKPIDSFVGRRAVLISGVARPEGFEALVRENGIEVIEHLRCADHASYSDEDVRCAEETAKRAGADLVLTTEKDEVKLRALREAGVPMYVASMEMGVAEGERWEAFLGDLMKKIRDQRL